MSPIITRPAQKCWKVCSQARRRLWPSYLGRHAIAVRRRTALCVVDRMMLAPLPALTRHALRDGVTRRRCAHRRPIAPGAGESARHARHDLENCPGATTRVALVFREDRARTTSAQTAKSCGVPHVFEEELICACRYRRLLPAVHAGSRNVRYRHRRNPRRRGRASASAPRVRRQTTCWSTVRSCARCCGWRGRT